MNLSKREKNRSYETIGHWKLLLKTVNNKQIKTGLVNIKTNKKKIELN